MKLISVMSASSALSERSFSASKRIRIILALPWRKTRMNNLLRADIGIQGRRGQIDVAKDFYTENSRGLSKLRWTFSWLISTDGNHYIFNYGGHTGLNKFHSLHCHSNLTSNFEWTLGARTSVPFFSIVWYSLSITSVPYSANCRHFSLDSNVT